MKENWPRGRVAHSFLKTNYNLVGRRLGHGRMQMKWYIIQGKMLPRVTILVTQIKTESSRKWKDVNFNLLEQQCIATLRHVVTPIVDGVPEPPKWWQLSERKCKSPKHEGMLDWHRTTGTKSRVCFKYSSCLAFALDLFKCTRRGGRKKHHRDQEQKRVSDFSRTSRPALYSS